MQASLVTTWRDWRRLQRKIGLLAYRLLQQGSEPLAYTAQLGKSKSRTPGERRRRMIANGPCQSNLRIIERGNSKLESGELICHPDG